MIRKIANISLITTMTAMLLSCVSSFSCIGCNVNKSEPEIEMPWSLKPQESFGLVNVTIQMKPISCIQKDGTDCKNDITVLPPKKASSVGSSIVVAHRNNETYVLTADHVCSVDATTETAISRDGKEIITIENKVVRLSVTDYFGVNRKAKVYRRDVPNDLCIVKTKGTWATPIDVSERNPVIGEMFYNVAAPLRIWSPKMVLMMKGYYSGRAPNGFYHYTIPARPGSSGSPILTKDCKIIGMVQRAVIGFEHVTISTSDQAIRDIIKTIPEPAKPKPVLDVTIENFKHRL